MFVESGGDARGLPTEELEREITRLAAHIFAATARWLALVAEYDRRAGWVPTGARSTAEWVAWRCSLAPGAAREHVRVARRLEELPLIRAAFAAGELSYSKVRALTRIDDVEQEENLLKLARAATASQLERLVRGYRRAAVLDAAADHAHRTRRVEWHYDDDGSLVLRAKLPPEEGAVVVAALEAGREQLRADVSAETSDVSAETPEPRGAANADALVLMADALLKASDPARPAPERHQIVVHVDAATLQAPAGEAAQPAQLADSGVALPAETARRLACDASIVRIIERDGRPLSVGRRTRTVSPALRRALATRDGGCQFPGCTRRRGVDAHHVEHWAHGGRTDVDNLVLLCRHHHRLVHEGGFGVRRSRDGGHEFRRPDGRRLDACPALSASERPRSRIRPSSDEACVPLDGGRFELWQGVDVLLACAPPRGAPGI